MLPEIQCNKCGLKWLPRSERPKKCPRCGKSYKGPVLVGALLDPQVYSFFEKIDMADFQSLLEDRLAAEVEAWQLQFCDQLEKGKSVDLTLFRESVKVLELLGEGDRSVKEDTVVGIIEGRYPSTTSLVFERGSYHPKKPRK